MVAIKSKGGDCWHYDVCVVLDGNPLVAEISDVTECMTVVFTNVKNAGQFKGIISEVIWKITVNRSIQREQGTGTEEQEGGTKVY